MALVLAATVAACGSRLPDEVLTRMDEAALQAGPPGPGRAAPNGEPGDAAGGRDPASAPGGATDGASGSGAPGTAGAGAGDGGSGAEPTGSAGSCSGGATDTGVTADEVKVASIVTESGPLPGATAGGYRGAAAYLAKVNAEGGVCGRQITILKGDDGLDPQRARGEFLRLEPEVLAFVGSYSVADSGYLDLIESTGVPYVGTSVDPAGRDLPSIVPHYEQGVGHSGPYEYYRGAYPSARNVGFMFADVGGVRSNTVGVLKGFREAGFEIVYNSGASATSPDFTTEVINLRQENTQLLYLFAFEVNMHVRLARNMRQQNWEPAVKVSNIGYNSELVDLLGSTANGWSNHIDHLPMLNADEPARSPALSEFLTWHDRLFPGSSIDLFPVTTWGDAARFVEALRQAGGEVTREEIVELVDGLPESDGGGISAPTRPAERQGASCFVVVRVEAQEWVREHPDSGYECDLGERYTF